MDSTDNAHNNFDSGNFDDCLSEDDNHLTTEQSSEPDNHPYEVLTTKEVMQHMHKYIKDVQSILELPSTTIRILLNHFNWDKEKLTEKYYDGDQDSLFIEAHIINPHNLPSVIAVNRSIMRNCGTEFCEICLTNFPSSAMIGLKCGHNFCKESYTEYLTTKIMDEKLGQTIPCAAYKCEIIVDDEFVMKLIIDAIVKQKYQQLITTNFVNCNRLMRWCPSPECTYAAKVIYPEVRSIRCKCGYVYCFECGNDWHEPITCQYLRKWISRCAEDGETFKWMETHTKECPKCHIAIEKNGGCNHMVCYGQHCKHEFCWICLGPWKEHRQCNIYEDDGKIAHESLRACLVRYLHYFSRYENHIHSLKLEHALYDRVNEKMTEVEQYTKSWMDIKNLKHAIDILCKCRQTLTYSYVFAYYIKKENNNHQMDIFEDNQKELESTTEQLSEYLERDMIEKSVDLNEIILKVRDKCQYCEKRRKTMLNHVHEGYEQNLWTHIDQ